MNGSVYIGVEKRGLGRFNWD